MTQIFYDPQEVEKAAQQDWQDNHLFETKENLSKPKFYCLSMLPYPSGELHMGHIRNYTIGDVIARYQMMLGKNVLQPMGWDAFGLPAENAAITRQISPYEWTQKQIKRMRQQFKRLGYAIDWRREIATCDVGYYRWEQWLFLKLYEKGLVYKKNALVNWDPVDQTVLANEQVVDGRGWRSGALIERREISQWFVKITAYAESLLNDLDQLSGHWPEQVITMQRHWIGRSEGTEVLFKVSKSSATTAAANATPNDKNQNAKAADPITLAVFTTRVDTLFGVSFIAIAPEHPLAEEAARTDSALAQFIQQCRHTKVAEAETATLEKITMHTSCFAIHPLTDEKIPILVANYVLMEYGTGAVMAVPAHDARDFEVAKKYQLPILPVIIPADAKVWDYQKAAYTGDGRLINSESFDGQSCEQAKTAIQSALKQQGSGARKTQYRLRDWGISRQRYWGTPIPIIYCADCGIVPVPNESLPVELPLDLVPCGQGSPLATSKSFYETTCPLCHQAAKRETDTMDTFVESSWYYARYCCFDQQQAMLDNRSNYWCPVDQYVGGIEHAVLHLLYARFFHKLLRDEGLLNSDEPFQRLLSQGMVLKDGAKMSKSKGNVVSPQALIDQFGADTIRLFIIFAAPPEQSLEWSDSGVEGCSRFLKKLALLAESLQPLLLNYKPEDETGNLISLQILESLSPSEQAWRQALHQLLKSAQHDMERLQFNTVVSTAMKIYHLLAPQKEQANAKAALCYEGMSILLRVLTPITPHICHYLWQKLGFGDNVVLAAWPRLDTRALNRESFEIIVQVDGKKRGGFTIAKQATASEIEEVALSLPNVQKYLEGLQIKKIIAVPGKLLNIVTTG